MGLLNKQQGVGGRVATDTLAQQELNFLLKVLSEAKFDGKDVLLLGSIVTKLTNQLEAK
jgi:hypothetical protein